MSKTLVLCCFLSLIALTVCLKEGYPSRNLRKQLAGPPSEFPNMATPSPEETAARADSSISSFMLTTDNSVDFSWTASYPIDAHDQWTLSIASPYWEHLNIWVQPPNAVSPTHLVDSLFTQPDSIVQMTRGPFGIDGNSVPTTSYSVFDPMLGDWSIIINTSYPVPVGVPHGYVILDNQSRLKLVSHLNSFFLDENEQLGLVVRVAEELPDDDARRATGLEEVTLKDAIQMAEMQVTYPDGSQVLVPMSDSSLTDSSIESGTTFGASIDASAPGQYIFQARIHGTDANGLAFIRTTQHLVAVSRQDISLSGTATAQSLVIDNEEILQFQIGITLDEALKASDEAVTVRAYAEVYGTAVDGSVAPVAWVSAMVDPSVASVDSLDLDLNMKWISLANVNAPFQLRNVLIQDINSMSIIDQADVIDVSVNSLAVMNALAAARNVRDVMEITEAMRFGPRPAAYQPHQTRATSGKLMLVHGYCSGDVWPLEDFENAIKFEDYSQSRSQDEFAKLILAFGESAGLQSYGIVAHSQGGLAALHLKSYYWSGLDLATGGRLIQSVGSPYYGCSLAGSLADIGSAFGVGCASNFDLSIEGAQLWLSKIPSSARDAVYYYTTQYSDDWWISSACVTGSSLVMYAPNDGTCEKKFADLEGGHVVNHLKGECHTTGMKYPAQTLDKTRNAEMSKLAAR